MKAKVKDSFKKESVFSSIKFQELPPTPKLKGSESRLIVVTLDKIISDEWLGQKSDCSGLKCECKIEKKYESKSLFFFSIAEGENMGSSLVLRFWSEESLLLKMGMKGTWV